MFWWASVYQLCSKDLITCYKTPADWIAAVPYQFYIFGPEKGKSFAKKKNRVADNTTQKMNTYIFKKVFK